MTPREVTEKGTPAVVAIRRDGLIFWCSRAASELIGRAAEDIRGHSIDEFLTEESGYDTDARPKPRTPGVHTAYLRQEDSRPAEIAFRVVPVAGVAECVVVAARTASARSREEIETMLEGPHAQREIDVAVGDLAEHTTSGPEARRWQDRRRRLSRVHDASVRIGSSLEVSETAQELADLLVPDLGDLVTVDLAEAVVVGDEPPRMVGGGRPHLLRSAISSASGAWLGKVLMPGAPYPVLPDSTPLREIQMGEVITLDRASVVSALGDDDLVEQLVPPFAYSVTVAPLIARDLILGTLSVWRDEDPAAFQEDERKLLAEIASRAALGIDNARRHNREQRAAVTLQERLLPSATTSSDAVSTVGIYRPAGRGAGIRGDWFDVITLPSLRVALVIGDVVGHGLSATATMGRLRTAIQTLADLELDPAELLAHVDELVQRLGAEAPTDQNPVGATCLYAIYDPLTRQCTLASAGQLPAVAMHPGGSTEFIDVLPGPPLGVGGVPFESKTVELEPGSVLVLYTNGLLEPDHQDSEAGMDRLRSRLDSLNDPGRSLEAMGNSLLSDLGSKPTGDDIAFLLARTRAVPPDSVASWEYPAEPDSVALARRDIMDQLMVWGLEDQALDTELVVSELVTNAVRYTGGPVGVRLIRDNVLICEVTDSSNTQPRLIRANATDEGGRGLFIVAQCTTRWGSRYGLRGKTIWTEQPLT
ncbi:SpoIIE family protein phosphatase [Streptomyces sp. NPDC051217]|uniref:ATP-binding SpoIIE family protein phosphatase n=1 Tax=Streptomyces sp. NPDC051217 TaxID=3365644 RepID=UPI0037982D44